MVLVEVVFLGSLVSRSPMVPPNKNKTKGTDLVLLGVFCMLVLHCCFGSVCFKRVTKENIGSTRPKEVYSDLFPTKRPWLQAGQQASVNVEAWSQSTEWDERPCTTVGPGNNWTDHEDADVVRRD